MNRRTLGLGSATALILGVGLSAVPSTAVAAKPAAAQVTTYSISLVKQTLISSTHHKLHFSIGASQGEGASVFFGVTSKGTPESHTWSMGMPTKAVQYNSSTGKGLIKTGHHAKPFGVINMKIKNHGKKHTTGCQAAKTVVQPIIATGAWKFNTRSHGKHKWGKAGRHGKVKGFVSYSKGTGTCPFTLPCFAGTSWSAIHSVANGTSLDGSVSGSMLFANKGASLAKPKNAFRSDSMDVPYKNQTFKVKKGRARVTLGGAPHVTGSAVLTAPKKATSFPQPCGKGKTETESSWQAAYKNGKKPLVVHEQIEGSFKVPNISANSNTDAASIRKVTVK